MQKATTDMHPLEPVEKKKPHNQRGKKKKNRNSPYNTLAIQTSTIHGKHKTNKTIYKPNPAMGMEIIDGLGEGGFLYPTARKQQQKKVCNPSNRKPKEKKKRADGFIISVFFYIDVFILSYLTFANGLSNLDYKYRNL